MFKKFMNDPEALDMYVSGAAGTGKTTNCAKDVQYCIDNEIPYVVCAYTHKACEVLASKLPPGANIKTLHSFLGKRPTINVHATEADYVSSSLKVGQTDAEPKVVFIDEWSMIGERDYDDMNDLHVKAVWMGDAHQLPPVGDVAAIKPVGEYHLILTKQWRNDNPLQKPLNALISYLEGAKPAPLKPVKGFFERNTNIIEAYKKHDDAVLLAFTNKRVQFLNTAAQGYSKPKQGDELFSPTTRSTMKFMRWVDPKDVFVLTLPREGILELGSKYKTLELLIKAGHCKFAELATGEVVATVFGHSSYNLAKQTLVNKAAASNKTIKSQFKVAAVQWASQNPTHVLARQRAKAWREYISFNDCVICLDFNHAMTIHKSQGSTFNVVCLDSNDVATAMRNFTLYLKLMYVAISRAAKKVYTN